MSVTSTSSSPSTLPPIPEGQILLWLRDIFGLEHVDRLVSLGSCQDLNFKVVTPSEGNFVLKVSNPSATRDEIEFQNHVMGFVGSSPVCGQHSQQGGAATGGAVRLDVPRLRAPVASSSSGGQQLYAIVSFDGLDLFLRLQTFVEGDVLSSFGYLAPPVLVHLGASIGAVDRALSELSAAAVGAPPSECEWDMKHAERLISELADGIADDAHRVPLKVMSERASAALAPHKAALRSQVIHGDPAVYNVVARRDESGRPYTCGMIDFCDAMVSWLVGDLAVCVVSALRNATDANECLGIAGHIASGFHSAHPLTEDEALALWPLAVLRNALVISVLEKELRADPTNEYNLRDIATKRKSFELIRQVPIALGQQFIARRLGFGPSLLYCNAAKLLSESLASSCLFQSASGESVGLAQENNNGDSSGTLDLSVMAPEYLDGNWLSEASMNRWLVREYRESLEATSTPSSSSSGLPRMIPHGVARLHYTSLRSQREPESMPLHLSLLVQPGLRVVAPADCTVYVVDSASHLNTPATALFSGFELTSAQGSGKTVVMRWGDICIMVYGSINVDSSVVINGAALSKGACLGTVSSDASLPSVVNVQAVVVPPAAASSQPVESGLPADLLLPPPRCTPSAFLGWEAICPDPKAILGASSSDIHPHQGELVDALQKRHEYVASIQVHYYKEPPRIERGWREFMYDAHGRAYLDIVNNVTVLGHCHPAVREAVTKQLGLLNTNSRFVYAKLGEYAGRVIEKFSKYNDKLNVVFFVNSGSEATDLAMRIARTVVTERRRKAAEEAAAARGEPAPAMALNRDTICLEGAYHGVTVASNEVSSQLYFNPRARNSQAPWIHRISMPNPLWGKYTVESTGLPDYDSLGHLYAECVADRVKQLAAEGRPPAVFIAETLSGNAGGVELPQGYLREAYAAVRSVGGLCIADEVQVGYGRMGKNFWCFEDQDVVPDLVTSAKAAGNGHPLGLVITSKEIAKEFGADGSFFSSAGGAPVSCAVGLAVLDTIKRERLQENALELGTYLKEKLNSLAVKHPTVIGRINGKGLYLGIDIIRIDEHGKKVPATKVAYAVCERLLELGVICHNTGDFSSVLKVKPPLCANKDDADFLVEMLDYTFTKGW